MDKEEKRFDWKNYELNIFAWHLIAIFLAFIINILAYRIHLFTYGIEFWFTINNNWDTLIKVNIAIPIVVIIIWDVFHWNYWRFGGIIFFVVCTLLLMMFASNVEDASGLYILVVEVFFVILSAAALGKPGGIVDRIIDKQVEREYSDKNKDHLEDYDSHIMSLRAFYKGDMEPYEVLYEQVGVMLEHEILDDDVMDALSAKEHEIYDYSEENVSSALSLNNPNYNPLHSANRFENKEQYYAEIAAYVESGLMTDFLKDYHGKKEDKNYTPVDEKDYDIKTVEKVMRMYIEKLDQPEMLIKYCVIALYKNMPEYKKFSLMAARTYCTVYIQAGVVKYGDLFVDLIALLNASGITEVEDLDEIDDAELSD